MKTKAKLATATAENVKEVVQEALATKEQGGRGWTKAQVLAHCNNVVKAALAEPKTVEEPVAVYTAMPRSGKVELTKHRKARKARKAAAAQAPEGSWPGGTVGGVPKFNAANRQHVVEGNRNARAAQKAPAQRVKEPLAQYTTHPTQYSVLLSTADVERQGVLKVWPARQKQNGQEGLTHSVAWFVDGANRVSTLPPKVLKRLLGGGATEVWWDGEPHVATVVH